MSNTYQNDIASVKGFMWLLAAIGFVIFIWTALQTNFGNFDSKFVIIALFTIILSSRIVVDIPALKSNISVSDVFLFLIAILFGFEAAILLATVEAYMTSFRFTRQIRFRAFNAGTMAISLFIATHTSAYLFKPLRNVSYQSLSYEVLGSLGSLILAHYLINTSLMAIANSLRTKKNAWQIWKESYLWMSTTSLASGSIALTLAIVAQSINFYAILLGLPILGVVYFSYRNYYGKLEISIKKTEQAQQHLLEMQASAERFRGAFGQAPIGMALVSKEGSWLQVNQSLCKILGCAEEELLSKNFQSVVHQADLVNFLAKIGLILQEKIESFQIEARLFHKNGAEIWTTVNISLINNEPEQTSQLIFQIQDITSRRAAEEKLHYAAFYDSLTNLANRALFLNELTKAVEKAKCQTNYCFAVVFMDLDRFKMINDSMGHIAGDELLIAVAQRLSSCLGSHHTIARLSGDEFAILLDNTQNEVDVSKLVEKIQQQFSLNYSLRGHSFFINASMGISIYKENYQNPEDMLRDADTALHQAKAQGKARYLIFDEKMHSQVLLQLQMETDLRVAVEQNQFFLHYQPIISLETNTLAGFEALVRWQHPENGLVNPADFIPIAEETGDIIEIGKFVMEESCRQLKKWDNEFNFDLPISMSINVSPKQFSQGGLFETVMHILEKTQVNPRQLKLEITESAIVDNIESATLTLKQLRLLGIQISMDDFGTGYSSLSYLHRLPITTLKIDRSFIMNMETKKESAEIVHTIILLAKKLGLNVVAEGIETESQLNLLKEFECNYGQGFYFSKPVGVSDTLKFFKDLSVPLSSDTQSLNVVSKIGGISNNFPSLIEITPSSIS